MAGLNEFYAFMAEGDASARAMLGRPAVFFRGAESLGEAPVMCAPAMEGDVYTLGGVEVRVKLTASVRKDALRMRPENGDRVRLGENDFYIVAVSTLEVDPCDVLQLVPV